MTIANVDVAIIEYKEQRVLTTAQVAQVYKCEPHNIKKNFNDNKGRFTEGKHYFKLEGDELRQFKDMVTNSDLVGKNANILYLWTRQGASRHCKMLGTDRAWDMFDCLEENYFNPPKQVEMYIPQNYPDALRAYADAWEQKQLVEKENIALNSQIEAMKPKVDYTDKILQSSKTVPITLIAKDYGMSAQAMNKILHDLGIIWKCGEQWVLYADYQGNGYAHSKTEANRNKYGEVCGYHTQLEWTQKGRLFLYNFLKEKRHLLPMIERNEGENYAEID
jgi:phage antirepressor YoqD-like protein